MAVALTRCADGIGALIAQYNDHTVLRGLYTLLGTPYFFIFRHPCVSMSQPMSTSDSAVVLPLTGEAARSLFCDVTFRLDDGTTLSAHKAILAAQCGA